MTPENQRENIREELDRASESLEAANLLAGGKYYKDAISRLYYSLFHTTKALLLSIGLEARNHEGVLRLLGMHFVKTGILTSSDSHILSRLMKYREEADYNPSYVFNEQDFKELLSESQSLDKKIRQYLKDKGYIKA